MLVIFLIIMKPIITLSIEYNIIYSEKISNVCKNNFTIVDYVILKL